MPKMSQEYEAAEPISDAEVTLGNVLQFNPHFTQEERRRLTAYTVDNLMHIMPRVFARAIEPVTALTYPLSSDDIRGRCSVLAVERATVSLASIRKKVLRALYRPAPAELASAAMVAREVGSDRIAARPGSICDVTEQLEVYIDSNMEGSFNYAEWALRVQPQHAPRSVLVYLARQGQPIPRLGSLRDLDGIAEEHFTTAADAVGLSPEAQRLVRLYYGIGIGGVGENWNQKVLSLGYACVAVAKDILGGALRLLSEGALHKQQSDQPSSTNAE